MVLKNQSGQNEKWAIADADKVYAYVGGNPVRYVDSRGLAPGDNFPSPNAAAIDAGSFARSQPNQRIEYGVWIFPTTTGFSYDFGKGTPFSMPAKVTDQLRTTCPAAPVAAWHTHPDPGNDDPNVNVFNDNDKAFAHWNNLPDYLTTPMGPTMRYDPATGTTTRVSR